MKFWFSVHKLQSDLKAMHDIMSGHSLMGVSYMTNGYVALNQRHIAVSSVYQLEILSTHFIMVWSVPESFEFTSCNKDSGNKKKIN